MNSIKCGCTSEIPVLCRSELECLPSSSLSSLLAGGNSLALLVRPACLLHVSGLCLSYMFKKTQILKAWSKVEFCCSSETRKDITAISAKCYFSILPKHWGNVHIKNFQVIPCSQLPLTLPVFCFSFFYFKSVEVPLVLITCKGLLDNCGTGDIFSSIF